MPLTWEPCCLPDRGSPDATGSVATCKAGEVTGRSVQTISGHLAKLRTADVVRYETEGGWTRYWVKPIKEIRDDLESLKRAVGASSKLS